MRERDQGGRDECERGQRERTKRDMSNGHTYTHYTQHFITLVQVSRELHHNIIIVSCTQEVMKSGDAIIKPLHVVSERPGLNSVICCLIKLRTLLSVRNLNVRNVITRNSIQN